MTTATVKDMAANRVGSDPWGRSLESVQAYNEAKEALNERARAEWRNPDFHREVAADIESIVDYQFQYESLFRSYLNVEQVGEWDRVIVRERRGLKVFYTSRGGYIEESQLRTEQWELPRDTMGFHVSEHIDKLRARFSDTIEDLVSLGGMRMEAEVNRRVIQLMQTAIPSSSPYYVATAGLTKLQINAAITAVRDAIKPDGTGMVPITIMGRAAMVDKVTDFDLGFDPEATAEIRARGRLGVYRGATVQSLQHYTDEDGTSYIPANEVWVFGGNVGKFALYGGTQVKDWDEDTVDYRHYRARRDIGGLVHHPEQARRIVDSSVTP